MVQSVTSHFKRKELEHNKEILGQCKKGKSIDLENLLSGKMTMTCDNQSECCDLNGKYIFEMYLNTWSQSGGALLWIVETLVGRT